ncbi:MAG: helix-turn-helix domain-containing protein, partial [Candidatus Dormibacteraeota bacterium]|nr:helix-turn-helix domain-containing protein [Candidatus Dormibacteraeota bacterium]
VDHHNFDQRRSALGQRLRSLRRAAGLTGPALAARTGISQPKISKVETGRVVPSVEDVQALAQALDASPDVTASLVEHAHGLSDQIRAWRALRRQQLAAHQDRARHLEATATEITVFQNAIIPSLLQVAEYARQVFLRSGVGDDDELATAVAGRLNRQTVLFSRGKRFVFILTEAALRHRISPVEAMRAQYDRLVSISGLENVRIGVLPFEVELPILPLNNFALFDLDAVALETISGEVILRGGREVETYAEAARSLEQVMVSGPDAVPLIRGLAR